MVDITAWLDSNDSCDREPRSPPGPRFDRSNFVTDFVRFSGFDLKELNGIELNSFFMDWISFGGDILNEVGCTTYRFEKKFVNRDVDCCSGGFFWPKIGVDGAEPRRHAFSYDVSVKNKQFQLDSNVNFECVYLNKWIEKSLVIGHYHSNKFNEINRNVMDFFLHFFHFP